MPRETKLIRFVRALGAESARRDGERYVLAGGASADANEVLALIAAGAIAGDSRGCSSNAQTRGWVRGSGVCLWDAVAQFEADGLRHVLCTDIARDGALGGPNLGLYAEARHRFPAIEWQASGGVRDCADLAALAQLGVSAAVSGKALLENRLSPAELRPYFPAA